MSIDAAKLAFDALSATWLKRREQIETEQDARFHVIDLILTQVLGWDRTDIKTEPSVATGYVDYLLGSQGRSRFVVEAKRASNLLIDTKNPNYGAYKASGPALNSALAGLEQAQRYCLDTGVPFAALTTGFEWIAYWALRTDGTPAMQGKALAFPNLESITQNFAIFFDLFSKKGISSQLYQVHVHQAEGLSIQHAEPLFTPLISSEIRLLQKSKLAADLDNVFNKFFSTMSGDGDPEMLAKCFVESKESREADINLQKITRNLINRIDVVESGSGSELQEHIRIAVESHRGDFVLIIGNKGAGKSTFIDRFFRLVLERALRTRCLVVKVDLADSDGNQENVAKWLEERIKEEIERGLFGDKPPTYDELQGIFFSEYDRWRVGEHKHLYENNRVAFKENFGSYIADMVSHQPAKYVHRMLRHAIRSRKLMPCLLFDNTDHFPQAFQERVFQYAQAIYRANYSFVICPITDRTIWQLSKSGPLQSYESTALYLPVPSTKEVLEKRVSFLKEKLAGANHDRAEYFLGKGIRLTVTDLNAFAACIDEVFVHTERVSRIVGWLSNHDIRRSLNIAQRVITSPIVSMEDLMKTYIAEKRLAIPRIKIQQALVFGSYSQFNQEANDYILNVFSVSPDEVTSPLAKLSILRVLMDQEAQKADAEKAYMAVEDLQNYFESARLARTTIKHLLSELMNYRLVEPYDPTDQEVYEDQRVRITHCGQIHYEFAIKDDIYVTSMALTTGIRSQDVVSQLRDILRGKKMAKQDWDEIAKLFIKNVLEEDARFVSLPRMNSYAGQELVRNDLKHSWIEAGIDQRVD